jgi:uncharacterized membrane protein
MQHPSRVRVVARVLLVLFYLTAGVIHCLAPQPFVRVTPPWVPHPLAAVILTGLCEIAGGTGLLIERTRKIAGIMLAIYAACVYPANIMHAVHDLSTGSGLGWGYHYPRLFAQPLICWWALWAAGVVSGPVLERRSPASA